MGSRSEWLCFPSCCRICIEAFCVLFFLSRILPALMSLCPADTAAGAMVMHQIAINRMSTHWGFHRL
jgi:hypothetical protein